MPQIVTTKADEIISAINQLNAEELRELTHKVRTTASGIKAYAGFNHGIPAPIELLIEPETETA